MKFDKFHKLKMNSILVNHSYWKDNPPYEWELLGITVNIQGRISMLPENILETIVKK